MFMYFFFPSLLIPVGASVGFHLLDIFSFFFVAILGYFFYFNFKCCNFTSSLPLIINEAIDSVPPRP